MPVFEETMNHGIVAVLLLFCFVQTGDADRNGIQSVLSSLRYNTEDGNGEMTGTNRKLGNIFANRKHKETTTKGSNSKTGCKESRKSGSTKGKAKGMYSPAVVQTGKGVNKKQTSGPSTLVSVKTARPTNTRNEPSRSPKQLDVNDPTSDDNDDDDDKQCDLDPSFETFVQENCSASVYDVIKTMPDLSVTVALFELLNMTSLLRCVTGLTLLLPTNAAWSQIDDDMLGELLSLRSPLEDLLLYHILPEMAFSADLKEGFRDTLLAAQTVLVSTNPLMFDNAIVTVADQAACAGKQLFHSVDEVLMPNLPGLSPSLSPQTSSTEAPQQVPTSLPTSNIVSTTVTPTFAPIDCTAYDFGGPSLGCSPNLLATARQDPNLSLVVSLFEVAGLEAIFDCPGPISAALPTNSAIIKLGRDLLEHLVSTDQEALRELLHYHLFPGTLLSTGLSPGLLTTLSGTDTVIVDVGPVSFGGVYAISLDNKVCDGGIYHTIGAVLDPAYQVPSGAPSLSPTFFPTRDVLLIGAGRFYISFVSKLATEPTVEEYEGLRIATQVYYLRYARKTLALSHPDIELIDLSMNLNVTLHGDDAGKPKRRFNIYMEYADAIFVFSNDDPSLFPDGNSLFLLIQDGLTGRFILDVVRKRVGTPFEEVTEAAVRPIRT